MIDRRSAIILGKFNSRYFDRNYKFIVDEDGTGVDALIVNGWFTKVPKKPSEVI